MIKFSNEPSFGIKSSVIHWDNQTRLINKNKPCPKTARNVMCAGEEVARQKAWWLLVRINNTRAEIENRAPQLARNRTVFSQFFLSSVCAKQVFEKRRAGGEHRQQSPSTKITLIEALFMASSEKKPLRNARSKYVDRNMNQLTSRRPKMLYNNFQKPLKRHEQTRTFFQIKT